MTHLMFGLLALIVDQWLRMKARGYEHHWNSFGLATLADILMNI